jgi:hypothetical protein
MDVLIEVAFSQHASLWVVEITVFIFPLWALDVFLLLNLSILDGVAFNL